MEDLINKENKENKEKHFSLNKADVLFIDFYHSLHDNYGDGIEHRINFLYFLIDYTSFKERIKKWFYNHCKYMLSDLSFSCNKCHENSFDGKKRALESQVSYLDLINPIRAIDVFENYYLADSYAYFLDNTINCSYFRNPDNHFSKDRIAIWKYEDYYIDELDSYLNFKSKFPSFFNPKKNDINWLKPILISNYYEQINNDKTNVKKLYREHYSIRSVYHGYEESIMAFIDEELALTISNIYEFLEIKSFLHLRCDLVKSKGDEHRESIERDLIENKDNFLNYLTLFDNNVYYVDI